MSGFVYIWRDKKHKRFYIGSHWGTEDDGYICSSKWMKQGFKIRPKDFKRRILSRITTTRLDLLNEEYRWLSMIKKAEIGKRYYNLKTEVGHWSALDNSKTIKERISTKTKEAMASPATRDKYLKGLKKRDNKSSDPAVRKKRSDSMKATMALKFADQRAYVATLPKAPKFGSEEYCLNMAEKSAARWKEEGYKNRVGSVISASLKGKSRDLGFWWNNGSSRTRSHTQPGPDWVRGRV